MIGSNNNHSIDMYKAREVVDYANTHLSMISILRQHKIDVSSDEVSATITCPFHIDARPSFKIDFNFNKYHCFSCGRKGGSFSLIKDFYLFDNNLQDDKSIFPQVVEYMLQTYGDVSSALGFRTITCPVEQEIDLNEVIEMCLKLREKRKVVSTSSYMSIINKYKVNEKMLLDILTTIERGADLSMLPEIYSIAMKAKSISNNEFEARFTNNDDTDDDTSFFKEGG